MDNHDYSVTEQQRRVLEAHREAVSNGDQPLLNENIEGALFDAATHLLNDIANQLDGWAEGVKK